MMKGNMLLNIIMILSIVVLTAGFLIVYGNTNKKNIDFLKSYNWEVDEKPIEKVEIVIPQVFDDVYLNYNELQKEAGLDLGLYRGYSAVRYTYIVKNFPKATKEQVRANVICVDGNPIAGDICTVSIDGFMYSLNFNVENCFSYNKLPECFNIEKSPEV